MLVHEIMVPKHELLENIMLHVQALNYGEYVYELENRVEEKALSLNLTLELGPIKKFLLQIFPITY
jgi:hypothetical protein